MIMNKLTECRDVRLLI